MSERRCSASSENCKRMRIYGAKLAPRWCNCASLAFQNHDIIRAPADADSLPDRALGTVRGFLHQDLAAIVERDPVIHLTRHKAARLDPPGDRRLPRRSEPDALGANCDHRR